MSVEDPIMDEFAIEEAEDLRLESGIRLGDTPEGKALIDMARRYLESQQQSEMQAHVPCNVLIVRREDMSQTGRLRILRQEDGDMCVAVIGENGESADVEFCAPGTGGGKSPRTIKALRQLAKAMMDDNAEDPSRAAER